MNIDYSHVIDSDYFLRNITNKADMMSIIFRTTSACNMRCDYCYQHKTQPTFITEKHLPQIKVKLQELFDERKKLNCDNKFYTKITFIGGEVSLTPKINRQILDMIASLDVNESIWLEVSTNGYDFSDDFKDFLLYINKFKKFIRVNISLDINKLIHDHQRRSITGSKTYDNVLHNMQWLRDNNIRVNTNSVLTEYIINSYEADEVFTDVLNIECDRRTINIDYAYSQRDRLNEKELRFLNRILQLQLDYCVRCLQSGKKLDMRVLNMGLECVSYSLFFVNRLFCDIRMVHTFESVNDKDFIISHCHGYTYSDDANDQKMFINYNSLKSITNLKPAIAAVMSEYQCNDCELAPFCRQICLRYNKTTKCVIGNKIIAELVKKYQTKIYESDRFLYYWMKYIEKYGENGEFLSWTRNIKLYKERLLMLHGVMIE